MCVLIECTFPLDVCQQQRWVFSLLLCQPPANTRVSTLHASLGLVSSPDDLQSPLSLSNRAWRCFSQEMAFPDVLLSFPSNTAPMLAAGQLSLLTKHAWLVEWVAVAVCAWQNLRCSGDTWHIGISSGAPTQEFNHCALMGPARMLSHKACWLVVFKNTLPVLFVKEKTPGTLWLCSMGAE